jgi:hypothetical protein
LFLLFIYKIEFSPLYLSSLFLSKRGMKCDFCGVFFVLFLFCSSQREERRERKKTTRNKKWQGLNPKVEEL